MFLRTDVLPAELRARSVRAGVAAIGAKAALAVVGVLSTMILARMLTPADFGLLAMVFSLTALIGAFRDIGLPLATVYHEEIDHDQVSALWWVNVNVGALTALAIVFLSPALAWFYDEPRLTAIAVVMGVITFAECLAVQHEALLMRTLRFATLSAVDVASALAGLLAAVGLALAGAAYWALVAQYAAMVTIRSASLWVVCGWRPRIGARRALLRDDRFRALLSYGLHHAGSRLVSHVGGHLDRIVVGWFAGPATLGLYAGASRLAEFPYRQLQSPLVNVAVASLSRLQHDGVAYRAHVRRALQSVFVVSMPMLAFLIVEADSVVRVFLGGQWVAAAGLLRLLGVAWFALSMSRVTKWLYLSRGATKRELRWTVVSTFVMILGVVIGAPWGATGVAAGFAAAAVALTYPAIAFCLKTSDFTMRDFGGVVWRPALGSMTAATALVAAGHLGWPDPASAGGALLANAAIFGAAFALFWFMAPGGRRAAIELTRISSQPPTTQRDLPTPLATVRPPRPALRAADWRFLLPSPRHGRFEHLVLLGGPAGLTDLIKELDLAERVSRALPSDRSADAVVVLQDARVRFEDVERCLADEGALYYEINRRSPRHLLSSPRRVRRSLGRAGLLATAIYAVGPKLSTPRVYLPLDIRGAFGWYIDTLFNAWTPRLALVERALRALTRLDGRRFAPFALGLAVTAVRNGRPSRPPSAFALSPPASELAGRDLHAVMLSSTHLETLSQRVVILPFVSDGRRPLVVLKVSKLPSLNGTLDREQQTLAEIRRILGPGLRDTIPEPLGTQRWRDVTVSAETYRPGESLQRSSGRWGTPLATKLDDLRLATEWLAEFHMRTAIERAPWGVAHMARWLDAPMEAYGHAFGIASDERVLFSRLRAYGESLAGLPLPIVLRKPDFFGSNVLRHGRELSVIDWESPEHGPALCDLIRFVTPWSEIVRHARGDAGTAENFRRLFLGRRRDTISDAIHEAIQNYLRHLDMNDRFLPVLLVYTWVDRALHHREKQHRHGEDPTDTRAGNRHVGRVAILAQHVDQLFSCSPLVARSPLS